MFQKYEVRTDPANGPVRLEALRKAMHENGATVFLIPHADEHQNEYLPSRAERLAWLTGFTGSAGFCIVTPDKAVVFSDGRYTLQLREQVDNEAFSFENSVETTPSAWLEKNTTKLDVIAYDPWLITISQLQQYRASAKKSGAQLQATKNLVDLIWNDQPDPPLGQVKLHDLAYAGKQSNEKIEQIQETVRKKQADCCLITDPASLAWIFNIRGNDVVHNPLALGFCIMPAKEKPELFIDDRKLDAQTRNALGKIAGLHNPANLLEELASRSAEKSVMCDPNLVASIFAKTIREAEGTIIEAQDPVILPRAIKNETEVTGARNAHLRDGVAFAKFLYWLDARKPESLDEITVSRKLETIRRENAIEMGSELKEISFDTISGFGPNGAIVHYRVNTDTNRQFETDNLYLVDSGGQYEDGTTDITRTIAIGNPKHEAITDFTLVLKGHIAIATARFPEGTRGIDLDVLARNALWQVGKDYAHGTGHGVGSYMNVHEGPQGIHKRSMTPLQAGMIVSNEPGYYVEGGYGIRIENLVIVKEPEGMGGNIDTHSFETITLAPIDLRLVDAEMLTEAEKSWLNAYHATVFEKLSPHLDEVVRNWLENATRSI